MLYNIASRSDSLHPPFPLWAYLRQPVFNPYCKTIWHPQKFAYQHYIAHLNVCWCQELIQRLESCWHQQYVGAEPSEATTSIELPTSSA